MNGILTLVVRIFRCSMYMPPTTACLQEWDKTTKREDIRASRLTVDQEDIGEECRGDEDSGSRKLIPFIGLSSSPDSLDLRKLRNMPFLGGTRVKYRRSKDTLSLMPERIPRAEAESCWLRSPKGFQLRQFVIEDWTSSNGSSYVQTLKRES